MGRPMSVQTQHFLIEPGHRPKVRPIADHVDDKNTGTDKPDFSNLDEVAVVKWPLWWTIAGMVAVCSPVFAGALLALAAIAGWL